MKLSKTTVLGSVAAMVLVLAAAAAMAGEADELWKKNCASCHGPDGKAQTKMAKILKVEDLTDPAVHGELDRERIAEVIKNGIPKEGSEKLAMPAYGEKLSDEQIAALVDYVEGLGGQDAAQ